MAYRLRALLLLLLLALSLILFVPLLWLLFWIPLHMRFRFSNLWCRFFAISLRWIAGIDHRVRGLELLPSAPCLYFAKHQSAWETLLFQTIFPPYVWVIKREALGIPIFGWGLATLTPIAIDRKAGRAAMEQIIQQGKKRLAGGFSVLIFPEGTRVAVGQQRPFKAGGAALAQASGAWVVPIAHNAGLFWPGGKILVRRPGLIDVVDRPPFDPKGLTIDEINQRAKQWIDTTTARLEAQAEVT